MMKRRTTINWSAVYKIDAWADSPECAYCHRPLRRHEVTADHVRPRRNGGTDLRENITPACLPCNQTKGHMTKGQFVNALKSPPADSGMHLLLCSSARRIHLAAIRASKRIGVAAGVRP